MDDIHPNLFPCHCAVGFVAHLHHAYVNAVVLQKLEAITGVFIKGLCLCFNVHSCPCFGDHLLCRVCPKVAVMEIDKEFHTIGCCTLADFNCGVDVAVSAAVSSSFAVKRMVPYSHADIVDSVHTKHCVDVCFLAVKIVVLHTCVFKSRHCRCVHAQDEVTRHIFNLLDVQGVGRGCRTCVWNPRILRWHGGLVSGVASRHDESHAQCQTKYCCNKFDFSHNFLNYIG